MEDQAAVVAFLADSHSHHTDPVVHLETHISHIFLAGDKAYKLKRAVRLPYVDYSTRQLRRKFCFAELEINQRLAPDLYLSVLPIVERDGVLAFGNGSPTDAIDWVVLMRRFPQSVLLEEVRKARSLSISLMRKLGRVLCRAHASARQFLHEGGALAIENVIFNNSTMLTSLVDQPFDAETIEEFNAACQAAFVSHQRTLDRRRDEGFVRRCHGDLHLNNICLWNGEPMAFDAIEFDDKLAVIDVLYDFAFLLMDLDRHRECDLANAVFNSYLWQNDYYEGLELLPLFLACRAAIRAHVTASRALTHPEELHWCDDEEAGRLLARARYYLSDTPSRLIAIGGVSGTGKSTLAQALAPHIGKTPGAVVLRSDLVRKRMLGVAETERLPKEAYQPHISQRVYAAMAERARRVLSSGHSVIVDAVFGSVEERALFAHTARCESASFQGIWLHVPTAIAEERIVARRHDASDADARVLREQIGTVSEPDNWYNMAAADTPNIVLEKALALIGR